MEQICSIHGDNLKIISDTDLDDEFVSICNLRSITEIDFISKFNKSIDILCNIENLRTLIFNFRYDGIITKWPKNLKKITFYESITKKLPKFPDSLSVAYLRLDEYKYTVDFLSNNLRMLTLYDCVNPIIFTNSITHLRLYECHMQIELFPQNMTHFSFCCSNYEYKLPKITSHTKSIILEIKNYGYSLDFLPDKNNELFLINYDKKLDTIPDSQEIIQLSNYQIKIEGLHSNVKKLTLLGYVLSYDGIPNNIETLILQNCNSNFSNLPDKLKNLEITYARFKISEDILSNLPEKLDKLSLIVDNNLKLDNLPINLKILDLSKYINFTGSLDYLPFGLQLLKLPITYNQELRNLPVGLKKLSLGKEYNIVLDDLPNNLELLVIGRKFNKEIKKLPQNLKKIYFDENSRFNYRLNNLPGKLEYIEIHSSYYYISELKSMFGGIIKIIYKK